jgi:hypothetical protein
VRALSFGVLFASLLVPATAQITASYAPYGAGCNGTGLGLGANHVVPAAMANAYGASNNSIPFTWSPIRYQQVFLGADLPAAFTAGALALRQDNGGPLGQAITVDLEIQAGFTSLTPQTLNTTFAANFDSGPPIVVLPRAQVTFPDQPAGGPASPADFYLTIPWPNAFPWNPSAGLNLLLQVTVYGNSFGSQVWGYPLDATWGGTARLYGNGAAATTGTLESNYGLVMGLRELTNTAVPRLYSTATPMINDVFRVRLAQARASSFGVLVLGLSNTWWNNAPLDLAARGAPGCWLLASIEDTQLALVNASGNGSFVYSLPNNIYLLGMRFYNQYLVYDPMVNALGFVVSNAGTGLIGNQ